MIATEKARIFKAMSNGSEGNLANEWEIFVASEGEAVLRWVTIEETTAVKRVVHPLWDSEPPRLRLTGTHTSWPLCRRGAQGRFVDKPSYRRWPGQYVFWFEAHDKMRGSCAGQLSEVVGVVPLLSLAHDENCGKLRKTAGVCEGC